MTVTLDCDHRRKEAFSVWRLRERRISRRHSNRSSNARYRHTRHAASQFQLLRAPHSCSTQSDSLLTSASGHRVEPCSHIIALQCILRRNLHTVWNMFSSTGKAYSASSPADVVDASALVDCCLSVFGLSCPFVLSRARTHSRFTHHDRFRNQSGVGHVTSLALSSFLLCSVPRIHSWDVVSHRRSLAVCPLCRVIFGLRSIIIGVILIPRASRSGILDARHL
jgi:hypothetical protein